MCHSINFPCNMLVVKLEGLDCHRVNEILSICISMYIYIYYGGFLKYGNQFSSIYRFSLFFHPAIGVPYETMEIPHFPMVFLGFSRGLNRLPWEATKGRSTSHLWDNWPCNRKPFIGGTYHI